jgi:LacI family transcriptional regulator
MEQSAMKPELNVKTKRPTLRDVARVAGVSYQTVSRVINDQDNVSDDTRAKVRETIKALGYRPNRAAQILQTERSNTLEVVLFNSGFNLFIYAMARTAQQLGYHFVISAITEQEFERTLESAASRFVDGLILVPSTPMAEDYETLIELTNGIPFVQIGSRSGSNMPSVTYDQIRGARMAVQHLIDLGHQQIAAITGPLSNHHAQDRHNSYQNMLIESGLEVGPWAEADFTIEGGYRAMNALLDSGKPFTAVFTANDTMAMGANTALRERGLRVPDDLSLVGFDDIPESAHFVPGLTTIRQDFSLVGKLAVEYLANLIADPDTPIYQRILQPKLIVRESTRGPR